MPKLKLIGEINCHKCNEPIQIDENMGVSNLIGKRCPRCNVMNIIKVDINDRKVNKDRL